MYLNTSFSDWYVPIFLVHEKETGSPFVCHPHNPKAALRVEELFQLATAVVHVNHSECYRDVTTVILDTLFFSIHYGRERSVIVKLSGREFTPQKVFTGLVCIFGFLTAIANLGTSLYYLAVMPRLPEPVTGRIYLAGAAFNNGVYVNKGESAWLNFLHYNMISVVGISVVLLAIFVTIPKARREGRL